MPSRNIVRSDDSDSYYHVYSRGINRSYIFEDKEDKDYLLYLLSRHLSNKPFVSSKGYAYPHLGMRIELLTFCLMDNHFHFLMYQKDSGAIAQLMKSVLTSYTAYFNIKHSRSGPLFESRYKASKIDTDEYLLHISRYIHLNPRSWKYYPHSSLIYIRKGNEPEWLKTAKVLSQHSDRKAYIDFVADYEEHKEMLDELKHLLADK